MMKWIPQIHPLSETFNIIRVEALAVSCKIHNTISDLTQKQSDNSFAREDP